MLGEQQQMLTHDLWAHRRCTTSCRPWLSAGVGGYICVAFIYNDDKALYTLD